MQVYKSNRAERLVERLAEVLAEPLSSPFAPEWVVVQGRGMERWVTLELASRLGVCANVKFPFPRAVIERAVAAFVGDAEAATYGFEPAQLVWAIARQLLAMQSEPAFAPIAGYLAGDQHHRKLMQLSRHVADLFDRYAIHRPEMVLEWEARKHGDNWQALLWRSLLADRGGLHTGARARAFFDAVERGAEPAVPLPERLCFFGTSSLPPIYLRTLEALRDRLAVHLFVLTPSEEYWVDLRARRSELRLEAKASPAGLVLARDDSEEPGLNPLLHSMGRLHRDFQELLEVCTEYSDPSFDEAWVIPAGEAMLATLQADIATLTHRSARNAAALPKELAPNDQSISFHSCHGMMRELEVLHDQLIACFEADPTLEPGEVVVMMPNVEDYAPGIEAVFGATYGVREDGDRPRIPFQIADRGARASQPVAGAFARLLDAFSGRATAPELFDVLEIDLIRERFGLSEDDLDHVRDWVIESGIRWGEDEHHRAAVGQPAFRQNTWRFGLDRLLLGYATPGRHTELFCETAPYDDLEGSETAVLGAFVEFCETFFTFRARATAAQPVAAWTAFFAEVLSALISEDDEVALQHQRLRDIFAEVGAAAETAGFDAPVDLSAVRRQCETSLESQGSSVGFLAGGVTFCQLMPMRSIPFRVVCLVGMSDGAFPRVRPPLGFDLMAKAPALGDRTIRNEDRYLFLEALLAARERLIVTFVGQSEKNNAAMPPSVLVGELLDVLSESFRCPEGAASVRERVITRHPLQPFSPRYFEEGSPLFSYSAAHLGGAQQLLETRGALAPFVSAPLPIDEDGFASITLEQLECYLCNTAEVFCKQGLGLVLEDGASQLEDREPILLAGLEAWAVGDELLHRALAGESLQEAFAHARARGVLPLGAVGAHTYREISFLVEQLARVARGRQTGRRLDDVAIDLQLGGSRLTGVIDHNWEGGRLDVRVAKLEGSKELCAWVRHLALCAAAPAGYAHETILVGRAGKGAGAAVARFAPVSDAAAHLQTLVTLYRLGQAMPLPFFARTSRSYVAALYKARASKKADAQPAEALAMAAVAKDFRDSFSGYSEGASPYITTVFGDADPLAPDYRPFAEAGEDYPSFPGISELVFGPLLAAREELSP